MRLRVGPNDWRDLELYALPDFERVQINKVSPERGAWPPADRELVLERGSLAYLKLAVGDLARIEVPDGRADDLPIAGTAHDLSLPVATISGRVYGYVTFETLRWLDVNRPRDFNQLLFTVSEHADDRAFIGQVAAQCARSAREERPARSTDVRADPRSLLGR